MATLPPGFFPRIKVRSSRLFRLPRVSTETPASNDGSSATFQTTNAAQDPSAEQQGRHGHHRGRDLPFR